MRVPEKFEKHLQLSNSRRSMFEGCPRKYYWAYRRKLRSPGGATALRYGSVWHKGLEAYYHHIKKYGWEAKSPLGATALTVAVERAVLAWEVESENFTAQDDYRTLENLIACLIEYSVVWQDEQSYIDIVSTETPYQIPLKIRPEEEKLFPNLVGKDILFTGIIDAIIQQHGHTWALEHKTTGSWLKKVINSHKRSPQVIGYYWAARELSKGERIVEGIKINLHFLSSTKSKVTGNWGKIRTDFERDSQVYSDADMENWRTSSLYTLDKMEDLHSKNFFPMNLDNCYTYNRDCQYTELCEQNRESLEDVITEGFIIGDER